ncbi:hypothetical protein [Halovenus salina]|uniref:Uncharacterized protein n=1 Tax=Halovenus salina TaxID=1510225 RepID=A0ABD5W359_9EURY|nr:hypothetical protein [Halovenus salina]
MRDRLTRRQFVAGATMTSLGATVGLAGCLGGGDGDDVPDASFVFEVEGTTLTVTHDGGDALDEDNAGGVQILRETDDGEALLQGWGLPVEEGDSVEVNGQFASGQTIIVRWFTADQEEFADISTYDIE